MADPVSSFSKIADDFLRVITETVYCWVTTVDPAGRPRSRVMHPIFEVVDTEPMGWAVTARTPVKARHLAANPYLTCAYWNPSQSTATVDCVAGWVADDDTRRHVWEVFRDTLAPLGWGDLSAYEPEGIHHPLFQPLQLVPWRVQVLLAEQFAVGDLRSSMWRAAESPELIASRLRRKGR